MKEFNKTNIDPILYRGETYSVDIKISGKLKTPGGNLSKVEAAVKSENLKAIVVHCMHPNLKGKNDLWGKPYTPNTWIFTNRKRQQNGI